MVEYECSEGHAIGANGKLASCPVVVRGAPCKGTLKRVGKGSRQASGE